MAKSYGKDSPERFIKGALDGDYNTKGPAGFQNTSTSHEMTKKSIGGGQSILTATPMDNVGVVYDGFDSSMKDMSGIGGSPTNLAHSLTGASAVQTGVKS